MIALFDTFGALAPADRKACETASPTGTLVTCMVAYLPFTCHRACMQGFSSMVLWSFENSSERICFFWSLCLLSVCFSVSPLSVDTSALFVPVRRVNGLAAIYPMGWKGTVYEKHIVKQYC